MSEPENIIEFYGDGSRPFPRPIPAVQDVPAWLKQMPTEAKDARGNAIDTVKKCPPFLEAVTGGYLIPIVADVTFEMTAAGLKTYCEIPIIEGHPPEQLHQTPAAGLPIVKFVNPWIIKTPPGYSCLFVQPLNRFDLPFHILSGVVETDTYYREVHFPSVCLMKAGDTFVLKRGTPIVQIYPIKREAWRSVYAKTELAEREAVEQVFNSTTAYYRQKNWKRKDYR